MVHWGPKKVKDYNTSPRIIIPRLVPISAIVGKSEPDTGGALVTVGCWTIVVTPADGPGVDVITITISVGVGETPGLFVGVGEALGFGVGVRVGLGVTVGEALGFGVGVIVGVTPGLFVGVGVIDGIGVGVGLVMIEEQVFVADFGVLSPH